jgi:23S rRNA pseudouridine2605 synthase
VLVNNKPSQLGQAISGDEKITVNGKEIKSNTKITTIMLNKPFKYVVSRDGQGSKTIYDLLPEQLHSLKPVGRLDKDSSGLLLLTNDGKLANKLTHPSYQKEKVYEIKLDHRLSEEDFNRITRSGVQLEDGISKFRLDYIGDGKINWKATLTEGRNRQIRRTFAMLEYKVTRLHRIQFGDYKLDDLAMGQFLETSTRPLL